MSAMILPKGLVVLCAVTAVWALPAVAWQSASVADVLNATTFRNVGPFRTSAWVTEIAVPEAPARAHLYTIYAATRTGGLWKTSNNGITWDPISDSVDVAAVGAVAVAPSNSSIVWMGTGDQANARSSVLRNRRLQVHGCRQQLAGDGVERHSPHRPDRHPPDKSRCRLRGCDGSSLLEE